MVETQAPVPKKKKKTYTTIVVESPMAAPRTRVWDELQQLISGAEPSSVEFGDQMSNEPPWRYVYSRNDVAAVLCECSVTIRDDGDTCNVAWAALIDPLPDGASDDFVATIRPAFDGYVKAIAHRIADQS